MARGFPFVPPATFCVLLALSLQLWAEQPPVGTPLAVRRGHSGAAAQQPAGGGAEGGAMGKEEDGVEGRGGLLTTAEKLFFGGDGHKFVAYGVATGKLLWRSRIGAVSNAPRLFCWTAINICSL